MLQVSLIGLSNENMKFWPLLSIQVLERACGLTSIPIVVTIYCIVLHHSVGHKHGKTQTVFSNTCI